MHNILRTLNESQTVLDLGCGRGSFNYTWYRFRIIGTDTNLRGDSLRRDGGRILYVQSDAHSLPLKDGSIDAIICNNVLEHLGDYRQALSEISRVLTATGLLWLAIPDGRGFDDAFYRWLFLSGGHSNQFTFDRLVEEVRQRTNLKLVQSILLFSGFLYLKRPTLELFPNHRELGQLLSLIPEGVYRAGSLVVNVLTRWVDRVVGSRLSQYGWGFVFARSEVKLEALFSYFNVCWSCGAGNDAGYLKSDGRLTPILGLRFYSCLNCGARNVFVEPPEGLN
jgi:SAM-dependent methyltransferase